MGITFGRILFVAFCELTPASSDEPDYRVRYVQDQVSSGLSVAEYCRRNDLCQATFYTWRRLQREQSGKRGESGGVSFTEITGVGLLPSSWAAEIALASGTVVRVSNAADIRLLRAVFEVVA